MRSRTVREGSVGLLILLGLGLFAFLILWLRGVSLGSRSYKFTIEFGNIAGTQVGTPVRYRGVTVGKITQTVPGPNGVEVEVEVSPADLIIPRDVVIEANQSGFLGYTSVDITPISQLTAEVDAKPLDPGCNRDLIVCNRSRLTGRAGISIDELIRSSVKLTNAYSDPKLVANINTVTQNSAQAAAEVARLSRDLRDVAKVARQEISTFSASARAVNQTATKFGLTADQVSNLLNTNRATLSSTLANIDQITGQLRSTVSGLNPVISRVQQGQFLQNLDTLSANAAQAAANLRDVSNSLNSPANLAALQQTLDSARATFQNAEKITSDLDELTGDPTFRNNLKNLVNGLNGLVSSTQQLQQQAQVAQVLSPLATASTGKPADPPSEPHVQASPLPPSTPLPAHDRSASPATDPQPSGTKD